MKNYTGITWSNLELEGLLEDEDSCVSFVKVQKHFELYPFHLANLTSALDDILKPKLNSYDPGLDGFLLAYKNPKVLSPVGQILYDNFYVHIDIEADFYIFKPKVGQSLKGFVNKIGTNHVGVLVHKTFNISIPRPEEDDYWPGNLVKIGQEVRFTLVKMNFNSKLPYFRGFFKENYLEGCKVYDEQTAAAFKLEFPEDPSVKDGPAPTKSKSKKIVFDSDHEQETISKNDSSEPFNEATSSRSTKNRKRVSSDEDDGNSVGENSWEIQSSTESVKHRKKSRKNSIQNLATEEETLNFSMNGSINPELDDTSADGKSFKKPKKSKIKENGVNHNSQQQSSQESCETESDLDLQKHKKKKKIKEHTHCYGKVADNETVLEQSKNIKSPSNSESEFEPSQNIKKKKKKKKPDQSSVCDDTEDEKNHKKTIIRDLIDDDSNVVELTESKTSKKKKAILVDDELDQSSVCDDTEDEKSHKKTIIRNLVVDESNVVELKERKKSKKKKVILVDDDTVMDTEDERNYKSSLKPLIQSMENSSNDDFVFKAPKKKKNKKKQTESVSDAESEIDPTIAVKEAPESESEEKRKSKKKFCEKNNESDQEFSNENYESDLEDRKKAKALLKKQLNIKNEGDEMRKKVKKEKHKEHSFHYEH